MTTVALPVNGTGLDQDLDRQPCYGIHYVDTVKKAEHEGHTSALDCYLTTWDPPPRPWVKRVLNPPGSKLRYGRNRGWHDGEGNRSWHLAIGIRKDTGEAQVYCNVGSGPGPFKWRDAPTLHFREEPGQWFCRRCVAEWTRGVRSVTVQTKGIFVSKTQLKKLHDAIKEDVSSIEIRPTEIEGTTALIAVIKYEDQRDNWEERLLLAGDGVVKL